MSKSERVRPMTDAEVQANKDHLLQIHELSYRDVLDGSVLRSELKAIGVKASIIASLVKEIFNREWDGRYHVVNGAVLLRFGEADDLFLSQEVPIERIIEFIPQLRAWINARLVLGVARVSVGDGNAPLHDERTSAAEDVILENRALSAGRDRTLDAGLARWLMKVSRASGMKLTIAGVGGPEEEIYIPPKSQTRILPKISDANDNQDVIKRFIASSLGDYVYTCMVSGEIYLFPWEQAKDLREGDRVVIHQRRLVGAHYHVRTSERAVTRGP